MVESAVKQAASALGGDAAFETGGMSSAPSSVWLGLTDVLREATGTLGLGKRAETLPGRLLSASLSGGLRLRAAATQRERNPAGAGGC